MYNETVLSFGIKFPDKYVSMDENAQSWNFIVAPMSAIANYVVRFTMCTGAMQELTTTVALVPEMFVVLFFTAANRSTKN